MDIKFNIKHTQELQVSIKEDKVDESIVDYHIDINSVDGRPVEFKPVTIEWLIHAPEIVGSWNAGANLKKNMRHEWEPAISVKGTHLSPVICYFSKNQKNCYTVGYSQVIEPLTIDAEINEATGNLLNKVKLFTTCSKPRVSYRGTLRMDLRKEGYEKVLGSFTKWYEQMEDYDAITVPQAALEPVYSTWYSYHQDLSPQAIEDEAKRSKELGLKGIIVDDGWQTLDTNRGYSYTGDWELCEEKMGHMKSHVKRVQEMGLTYMIWYSVPYIGMKSKAWEHLGDKILYYHEEHEAGILDLRYPVVREYLIDKYKSAMDEWELDGLKLDFIDRFEQVDDRIHPDMDYASLQEAVDVFLTEVREAILLIRPDAMIEFRQRYIGPSMRNKANIFRVHDCPYDSLVNRVGITDLRLTSGNTAIHSDMIMWHPEDSVESAALQLINILHGVPQFSMPIDELSEEHYDMSKFYLDLWHRNKQVLLHGDMVAYEPELNYPRISLSTNTEQIEILSSPQVIALNQNKERLLIVNGTMRNNLVLSLPDTLYAKVRYYSATGVCVLEEERNLRQLESLDCPISGVIEIHKIA